MAEVLRITRLHVFLALLGVICISAGGYYWLKGRPFKWPPAFKSEPAAPPAPDSDVPAAPPAAAVPAAEAHRAAAQAIAAVGEAYRPLHQKFGDVPPVSTPLRAAKKYYAAGDDARARNEAQNAWRELKMYREKIKEYSDTYDVVRGDTLWRIAARHSPAKAGAGWVTIWKANKDVIKDFDRIEIGWTLTIPPRPTQYVMPFWKPLGIN